LQKEYPFPEYRQRSGKRHAEAAERSRSSRQMSPANSKKWTGKRENQGESVSSGGWGNRRNEIQVATRLENTREIR